MGEAPGRQHEGEPPFSSRSGDRLSELLGEDVRLVFRCHNLLNYCPPKTEGGKGEAFSGEHFEKARRTARSYCRWFAKRSPLDWSDQEGPASQRPLRVILAGGRVAKAFRLRSPTPLLEWRSLYLLSTHPMPPNSAWVAVIPHPSGVNRWWNEKDNVDMARDFLVAERERMRKG